ncbi:MAG: hypothetical protein R3C11_26425 [Planctomycetaceae bacterium]
MKCQNCGHDVDVEETHRRVRHAYFRGRLTTWDDLFTQAAEFATLQGRDNVISISHSEDKSDGVITVWYWGR